MVGFYLMGDPKMAARIKASILHKARLTKSRSNKAIRTKAKQRAEARERILDAAELVFSKFGLHGATLRDVAQEVGIHTSLVHYYFQDKLWLFKAVYVRRAVIVSNLSMKALDAYEKEVGDHPTISGALHAYLDTDLDLYSQGDEGWRNYAAFCAQLANTPEGAGLLEEHFDGVVLRMIAIFRKAMPDLPEREIFWAYHFVSGSHMHSLASSGRLDQLSKGLCKSGDLKAVKERMAEFLAAGFDALVVCG